MSVLLLHFLSKDKPKGLGNPTFIFLVYSKSKGKNPLPTRPQKQTNKKQRQPKNASKNVNYSILIGSMALLCLWFWLADFKGWHALCLLMKSGMLKKPKGAWLLVDCFAGRRVADQVVLLLNIYLQIDYRWTSITRESKKTCLIYILELLIQSLTESLFPMYFIVYKVDFTKGCSVKKCA